jgi:hypothetical protein
MVFPSCDTAELMRSMVENLPQFKGTGFVDPHLGWRGVVESKNVTTKWTTSAKLIRTVGDCDVGSIDPMRDDETAAIFQKCKTGQLTKTDGCLQEGWGFNGGQTDQGTKFTHLPCLVTDDASVCTTHCRSLLLLHEV